MFKYIVTWMVINVHPIPCSNVVLEDEFGRVTNSYLSQTNACFSTDTTLKRKEFTKKIDAVEFIGRGNSENGISIFLQPTLANFKLDSIKIKN